MNTNVDARSATSLAASENRASWSAGKDTAIRSGT